MSKDKGGRVHVAGGARPEYDAFNAAVGDAVQKLHQKGVPGQDIVGLLAGQLWALVREAAPHADAHARFRYILDILERLKAVAP